MTQRMEDFQFRRPKSERTQWKRLFGFFLPLKGKIVVGFLGLLLFSLVDAGMLYFIKPLVDQGLAESDSTVLRIGSLLVILIFLLRGIGSFISNYSVACISSNVTYAFRQQAFVKLQSLPLQFFEQNNSGNLISKITYDAEQVSAAISSALITILRETIVIITLLSMMFYVSWHLSAIFLVIGPVIALILFKVSSLFKQVSISIQDAMGDITKITERTINSHQDILILGTAEKMSEQFGNINNTNRKKIIQLAKITHISSPLIQLIASFAIAAVLLLASLESVLNTLSPGTFTMVLIAMGSLLKPLKQLTNVNQQLQKGLTAAASLFKLFDEPNEEDAGTVDIHTSISEIRFNALTFYHNKASRPAINNLNLKILRGKSYALVGASGGGKTTFFKLLLRLYSSPKNTITIDSIPIEKVTLCSLRAQFSVVSQDIVLIDDTIANNIVYGCHRTVTRREIEIAAEAANVSTFSQYLDKGLDANIGENGGCLSGGQRQRVAIARAILRDTPFILLDEATSALDNQSEYVVKQSLSVLAKDKTMLIIAHRLSTIEHVDQIIVMDQGRLVEYGTHQQLLQKRGSYWTLYKKQDT